jgi:hypothetical protein
MARNKILRRTSGTMIARSLCRACKHAEKSSLCPYNTGKTFTASDQGLFRYYYASAELRTECSQPIA